MVVMDSDTREERRMKARMQYLTKEDQAIFHDLTSEEQDLLLKFRDVTLDLTIRLACADKLSTETLKAMEPDHASLVGAILKQRNLS